MKLCWFNHVYWGWLERWNPLWDIEWCWKTLNHWDKASIIFKALSNSPHVQVLMELQGTLSWSRNIPRTVYQATLMSVPSLKNSLSKPLKVISINVHCICNRIQHAYLTKNTSLSCFCSQCDTECRIIKTFARNL